MFLADFEKHQRTFLLDLHVPVASDPDRNLLRITSVLCQFNWGEEACSFKKFDLDDYCFAWSAFCGRSNLFGTVQFLASDEQAHDSSVFHININCPFNFERKTKDLIEELKDLFGEELNGSKMFPSIKRGTRHFDPYIPTVDNLFIEYDFDEIVFHEKSQFQDVKIMHSKQFGNMLILDGDPNLAESDKMYTKTITGSGEIDYSGRSVLVLGGGDGDILRSLLEDQTSPPKEIIMYELDPVVIESCAKHMKTAGRWLDPPLKGTHRECKYQVFVEDCIPGLEKMVANDTKFDIVINDLTAIPVLTEGVKKKNASSSDDDEDTSSSSSDLWKFFLLILRLSLEVVRPGGHYFTQGNSVNATAALMKYDELLDSVFGKSIVVETKTVCVPSYHENWVFYHITK